MKTAWKTLFLCLFLQVGDTCFAQLCQGNLSNPVIHIDYGAAGLGGPNYGSALPAGQTTYTYVAHNNVQDGEYTIAKSPHLARPEWYAAPDNTPNDDDGYMFIVNADFNVGEFYRTRVTGLCESTIFEFSASIMNVLEPSICGGAGIDPNVRFEIRDIAGNLLGFTESGNIPETAVPTWTKHGVSITTSAGMTEVDVIMLNNAPGGCGNDLAIDDVQFRACGDGATITSSIPDFGICDGAVTSATFIATLDGTVYTSPVFKWQFSTNGGSVWNDVPGGALVNTLIVDPLVNGVLYRYKVAESDPNLLNTNCSIVSDSFEVIIHDIPSLVINPPADICEGENINLTVSSDKTIATTTWTLPDGSEVTTNNLAFSPITLAASGNYNVSIIDTDGCTNNEDFMLAVKDTSHVQINVSECVGQIYTLPNGNDHTVVSSQTFTHVLTKQNGCDSTIVTNLTALPIYAVAEDISACRGDLITLPDGSSFSLENNISFDYNLSTIDNCDSIVTRNFLVPDTTFFTDAVCTGKPYILPDGSEVIAEQPQQYVFNLPAVTHNCDSVVVLDLSVNQSYRVPVSIKDCPFKPITLPQGQEVSQSGIYIEEYISTAGCDSTVVYTVDVSIDNCNREDLCTIRLPSVFTPNGNTENDAFGPIIPLVCPYEYYQIQIFNRWGEKVFESVDPFEKWLGNENGQPANPGPYLYYLEYAIIMEDGSLLPKEESGSVVLVK